MAILTDSKLRKMVPGAYAADGGAGATRGDGRLEARCTGAGVTFFARFTAPDGDRQRIRIATFAGDGRAGGIDLKEARRRFEALKLRYQSGDRDLRAAIARDQAEAAAQAERERVAAQREAERRAGTVGMLLEAYQDALRKAGKGAWRDVRSLFHVHVWKAREDLWMLPAGDLTDDHVADLMGAVEQAGKARTADKLRVYLRAAYQFAIKSRRNPKAPASVRALGIRNNPADGFDVPDGARRVRDRALSLAELRHYWQRVRRLEPVDCALLTLHLLTGGQRVQQLARATLRDIDHDTGALVLRDGKGRRRPDAPRKHTVPLIADAHAAITTMTEPGAGEFVASLDGGLTGASYFQFHDRVTRIARAMVEAGEAAEPFTPGDIRRTVETRLSAAGFSDEALAALLSHGMGGVQARHYNRFDRLEDKRAALERLLELASGTTATVRTLPRRRSAK